MFASYIISPTVEFYARNDSPAPARLIVPGGAL